MLHFPKHFLWGASTAAHQIEGNNINSDWWELEHRAHTTVKEPSGDACDSYHRYLEDMTLLKKAGLNSYRFSIEWARIEPEKGFFSRAEIDHYKRMIDISRDLDIEPIVTLMHFTVPRWFEHSGKWLAPDAADRFATYVEALTPILEDRVQWVCTINEPNIAAMMAGSEKAENLVAWGLAAPDLKVADSLYASHQRARDVLSSVTNIKSGWTVATQDCQPEPGCEQIADAYNYPRDGWYSHVAQNDDWLGVQAYTRTIIGPEGPRPVPDNITTTLTGWEYYPPALEHGVRSAAHHSRGVPIMVTENGIATSDDQLRIEYTRGALKGLHSTIEDGINVLGYLHWSLLDNYEWAAGFAPTFGLIAVDRDTFVRSPKPSLSWLGDIARANTLDV